MRKLIFGLLLVAGLLGPVLAQKGGTTVPQVNTLAKDLMVYWKFDESSYGSGAFMSFGRITSTLTAVNSPVSSSTSVFGNAAYLLSTDTDYFTVADNAALSFVDEDLTISVWARVETIAGNDRRVINKGNGIFTGEYSYSLRWQNSSSLWRWGVSNGSATGFVNSSTATSGVYQHLICYHDATANEVGIIVNNGTAATVSYSSGLFDDSGTLYIGQDPTFNVPFDGYIDDIAIWRRRLTAAEIEYLYNSGSGRNPIP